MLSSKMLFTKGRRSGLFLFIVLTVTILILARRRSSYSYWSSSYKSGTRPSYGYEEAHPAAPWTALHDDSTVVEHPPDEEYERAKSVFVEIAANVTTERFVPNGGFGVVGDAWDPAPLRAVCEHTKVWEKSVVFECMDLAGSVVDVRQALLTCLRYAIEAGAGLIIPQITSRGHGTSTENTGVRMGLEYYFDQGVFLERLGTACPKLQIYQNLNDVEEQLGPVMTATLSPKALQSGEDKVISLNNDISGTRAPVGYVTLVYFLTTLGYYPVCRDEQEFVSSFSGVLPIRHDIARFAASVLFEMNHRFKLKIDPWEGITTRAYLGAHFRISPPETFVQLSNDQQSEPAPIVTLSSPWPKYEKLSSHFLALAAEAALPVIYVASGNVSSNYRLADDAYTLSPPIPVLTKSDLLSPQEKQALWKLSWDQQAAVDYLVLLKSSYFAGVGVSGFSWDMATRRMGRVRGVCASTLNREGEAGGGSGVRPPMPDGVVWKDAHSDLIGDGQSEWEGTMWP